jgi:hypothetical protein
MTRDASPVLALELVRPTRHVLAPSYTLVTSSWTVPVPVTNPGLVDAGDAVFTLEFTRQAVRRMLGSVRTTLQNKSLLHLMDCTPLIGCDQGRAAHITHLFIRAVWAVQVAVAAPSRRDAEVFRAVEIGMWSARDVWAVPLVRAVPTVVIPVADPTLLNALAVRASELVRATGVIWPCTRKYKKKCYYVYCTSLTYCKHRHALYGTAMLSLAMHATDEISSVASNNFYFGHIH